MKKIVVLLPTLNEVDNIQETVQGILNQEKNIPGWRIEVLIADSKSSDGTAKLARQMSSANPRVHYVNVGKGLGVGLIEGHLHSMKHLHPQILAQIDADGQIDPDVLPKLVRTIENGYNLALGSRFIKGGENNISIIGKIFSKCSSWYCKLIMGPLNINEFNTMTRAFTPQLFKKINLKKIPWKKQSFIIMPAFLNEAILVGAKYKEIPIICKRRLRNYSKNKIIKYTIDVIIYAFNARLKKWGFK